MSDFVPITLPSRCLTYKGKDNNSVNPEDVLARGYQGKDEIYLSQINPLNLERNYFEVIKSVITGIDPLKLTVGDRMYLILWEYIKSYSSTMRVKTVCSHCISEVEILVDLLKVETKNLPEDFKQPYEVTLPVSKEKVNLRLLTVEDEVEVEKYSKKHKDAMIYRYARTIVDDTDIIARVERLSNMKAKDIMIIMSFQDKFFHGPILESTFTCPNKDCGEEDVVDIPFRLDFFFPELSEFADFT